MRNFIETEMLTSLQKLPLSKKKAILALIQTLAGEKEKGNRESREEWMQKLLTTSVWSKAELAEIEKARQWINEWKPRQFF